MDRKQLYQVSEATAKAIVQIPTTVAETLGGEAVVAVGGYVQFLATKDGDAAISSFSFGADIEEVNDALDTAAVVLDCALASPDLGRLLRDMAEHKSLHHLEARALLWAKDRGIFEHATPITQWSKTQEEVEELRDAIEASDREETKDAIGDILVTLAIQAAMHGMDLQECFGQAIETIEKRSGKMVDGVFVKDE